MASGNCVHTDWSCMLCNRRHLEYTCGMHSYYTAAGCFKRGKYSACAAGFGRNHFGCLLWCPGMFLFGCYSAVSFGMQNTDDVVVRSRAPATPYIGIVTAITFVGYVVAGFAMASRRRGAFSGIALRGGGLCCGCSVLRARTVKSTLKNNL